MWESWISDDSELEGSTYRNVNFHGRDFSDGGLLVVIPVGLQVDTNILDQHSVWAVIGKASPFLTPHSVCHRNWLIFTVYVPPRMTSLISYFHFPPTLALNRIIFSHFFVLLLHRHWGPGKESFDFLVVYLHHFIHSASFYSVRPRRWRQHVAPQSWCPCTRSIMNHETMLE